MQSCNAPSSIFHIDSTARFDRSVCPPSDSLLYVVVDVVLVVASRCQARQHQRYRDTAPFDEWQFP